MFSQGETLDELRENIQEAYELMASRGNADDSRADFNRVQRLGV